MLLEYFGEETKITGSPHPCCDVCDVTQTEIDCSPELKAITEVVNELPGTGEKKVHSMHAIIKYTCYFYIHFRFPSGSVVQELKH